MVNRRDAVLDSIRGSACIIVLFCHVWSSVTVVFFAGSHSRDFWGVGKMGVVIFFLLSAYFAMTKAMGDGFDSGSFFQKKLFRVYFPYAVTILFGRWIGWLETNEQLVDALDLSGGGKRTFMDIDGRD